MEILLEFRSFARHSGRNRGDVAAFPGIWLVNPMGDALKTARPALAQQLHSEFIWLWVKTNGTILG